MIKLIHIDDEQAQLEITRDILMEYDQKIQIESYTCPKTVLENIEETSPDIVLSDYKMPDMNGIEFIKKLRTFSEIPVILYTWKSEEKLAKEAFDAGADDYITKSYEPAHFIVLLNRIKNTVDSHRIKSKLDQKEQQDNSYKLMYNQLEHEQTKP